MEKFETLARIMADDVVLDFKKTSGVELAYAFRTQPETGPLPMEGSIHLGPVLQDSTLNVLFEYRVDPSLTKGDLVELLRGTLKLAISALPTPVQPIQVEFSRGVREEANTTVPPPASIIKALGKLTLYRMQEKAHMEVEQGQFELAAQHMKQLATNLLSQGERSLAETVLMEAEHIERVQAFSEEGSKEIKYGTRALIASQDQDKEKPL